MHDLVSLVTTSSPIKAGDDHPLSAGQICGPSHPESEIWLLTARPCVSAGYEESRLQPPANQITEQKHIKQSGASLHVNKKRIFYGSVKSGRQNHLVPEVWGEKTYNRLGFRTNLFSFLFFYFPFLWSYRTLRSSACRTYLMALRFPAVYLPVRCCLQELSTLK